LFADSSSSIAEEVGIPGVSLIFTPWAYNPVTASRIYSKMPKILRNELVFIKKEFPQI
jgi:hypothetical protein